MSYSNCSLSWLLPSSQFLILSIKWLLFLYLPAPCALWLFHCKGFTEIHICESLEYAFWCWWDRCECHGHGDQCDPVTGEKCNCQNNTESDATCSSNKNGNQCWKSQCSKCRDSYMGNPTDGHQCYRQMTVDFKYCFDAKQLGKVINMLVRNIYSQIPHTLNKPYLQNLKKWAVIAQLV